MANDAKKHDLVNKCLHHVSMGHSEKINDQISPRVRQQTKKKQTNRSNMRDLVSTIFAPVHHGAQLLQKKTNMRTGTQLTKNWRSVPKKKGQHEQRTARLVAHATWLSGGRDAGSSTRDRWICCGVVRGVV